MLHLLMASAEDLSTLTPFFSQKMRPWELNKYTENFHPTFDGCIHVSSIITFYVGLVCKVFTCY
jgi:hypothetical protein